MENIEKIKCVLIDFEQNDKTLDEAANEILRLFSVVARIKQLKCDCGETENVKKIAICACCYNPNTGEW
jgi:hypothetical protein